MNVAILEEALRREEPERSNRSYFLAWLYFEMMDDILNGFIAIKSVLRNTTGWMQKSWPELLFKDVLFSHQHHHPPEYRLPIGSFGTHTGNDGFGCVWNCYRLRSLALIHRWRTYSVEQLYFKRKAAFVWKFVRFHEASSNNKNLLNETDPVNIRRLVRLGHDPNGAHGFVKSRPLHQACGSNRLEAAKALVGCGADTSTRNDDGWTCFHFACAFGDVQLVEWLVMDAKVDTSIRTNKDENGLQLACSRIVVNNRVVQWLLENTPLNPKQADEKGGMHCIMQRMMNGV